ncbi:MAG: glycoside hydrolase family 43 protein [Muribaculaceae bacterium]
MKKSVITAILTIVAFAQGFCQAQVEFTNPIIPGFHPDPSICRVGDDYYIVNSTFQYFPGVPIYHSRDLVNWEQIGNVLNRESQLQLGTSSSWDGIYAPTIRYNDGVFYMVTTNLSGRGNFFVTATNPAGPWSEPIWLKQGGIDPSFYFEDGRCYMVSNPGNKIVLCEIDPKTGEQLTPSRAIWGGTGGRYPEGPHIYRKDGYYYLLISEGGTELAHGLTIARSRNIEGPYESNPANPILTHCSVKAQYSHIQGTGHGDLIQSTDGRWWVVFLAYRNYSGVHHLGRETFIAPVEWKDGGWPVVNGGKPIEEHFKCAALPESASMAPVFPARSKNALGCEWIHIQNPIEDNYKVIGDNTIRLTAAGTLDANNKPTFVGRRQEAVKTSFGTTVDCASLGKGSRAGITVYQIRDGHAEVYCEGKDVVARMRLKSLNVELGRIKGVARGGKAEIRIDADESRYHFMCKTAKGWQEVGSVECSLLSTEVAGGFTGVILGLYAEGSGTAVFELPE